MKLTIHEARHVFDLRADVDKYELRRLFIIAVNKALYAYFAICDEMERPTQRVGFDGPEFAKKFVDAMKTSAQKRPLMEAFAASCQEFLTSKNIDLDEPYWGSDGPVTDKQHESLAKRLNELPSAVPPGLMVAFRVFQEDLDASTRVTVSALFDAISTMKRCKTWPK